MMEKNFLAHLNTVFSCVSGVDFEKIEQLGKTNIQLMVNQLIKPDPGLNYNIERTEKDLIELQKSKPFDVMKVTEVSLLLAYYKTIQGNKKITLNKLKTILASVKNLSIDELPIPTLRSNSYFQVGDEVMFYVGNQDKNNLIVEYNWVAGNILSVSGNDLTIFSKDRIWVKGSLDGRYFFSYADDISIFKRNEFYKIRQILQNKEDSDFIKIFLKNCSIGTGRYDVSKIKDNEKILKIILDENIQELSEGVLREKNEKTMLDVISIVEDDFSNRESAKEMVEKMKIRSM